MADPVGDPVAGTCIELWTVAAGGGRGARQPHLATCDAGSPSADGFEKVHHDGLPDGMLGLADVPIGDYLVVSARPTEEPGSSGTPADAPVTIRAGRLTRLALTVTDPRTVIVRTVADGAPLVGACYRLGPGPTAEARCDGPGDPTHGLGDGAADGILVLGDTALKAGPQPLEQTLAPPGYVLAPIATATLVADRGAEVRIENGVGRGGLIVTNVDPAGTPVGGACLELWTETAIGARGTLVTHSPTCDAAPPAAQDVEKVPHDGAADGTLGVADVAPGDYLVVERRPPTDAVGSYAPLADLPVTTRAGRLTRLDLERLRARGLALTVVDDSGARLLGACFQLGEDDRIQPAIRACDGGGAGGDGRADGIVVLTLAEGDKPGPRPLRETVAPAGYAPVAERQVTVAAEGIALTVTHRLAAGTGGLVATVTDATGQPLGSACVELWTVAAGGARGTRVTGAATCDAAGPPGRGVEKIAHDGLADGSLGLAEVVPGDYVLVGVRPPADAAGPYPALADTPVSIRHGRLTSVTLVATRPATVLVRKVDEAGRPLPGACFRLGTGREGQVRCDGPGGPSLGPGDGRADGLLLLGDAAVHKPGPQPLEETVAPPGYSLAAATTATLLADGGAEVTVTDEPGAGQAGGPPTTGLVPTLELEIDSTIRIRTLNALPVPDGVASARGRIRLEGDAGSGTWQGNGELASMTTSSASGATCPSIAISGEGRYDWQVRNVSAAPGARADRIVADLDSGPTVEQPDTFVMDACTEPIDGTLNTWENLFFVVHGADYGRMGLHVDGWTLVDGGAWETGGVLAEATWSGRCPDARILDCDETTTFRLHVVLVPGTSPGASPGDGGAAPSASAGGAGAIDASTPRPAASAGGAPIIDPPLAAEACDDVTSCVPVLPILAVAGVVALLIGGSTLLLRTRVARTAALDAPGAQVDYATVDIEKIAAVDLAAAGNEVPMTELELSASKVEPSSLIDAEIGDVQIGDIKIGDIKLGDKHDPLP